MRLAQEQTETEWSTTRRVQAVLRHMTGANYAYHLARRVFLWDNRKHAQLIPDTLLKRIIQARRDFEDASEQLTALYRAHPHRIASWDAALQQTTIDTRRARERQPGQYRSASRGSLVCRESR
jgi:hypothetical protein